MTLAAGTALGPYRIVAALGAGGMGEVYRAHDARLGRDVAIKVLPPRSALSSDARARFEREARTISQLSHPHICALFDVGREGEIDYLVMELLEGETLAHRVARGPLPVADVLRFGAEIASALDCAHTAGVVHRDLKPGNVMLTKSGAKLMDFGLARVCATPASTSGSALSASPTLTQPLTSEGAIVGTFQYMAPEQLEGHEADARADIWALGCVLYEMATGQRAFAGESQASLISAILRDEPRAIAELQPLTPPALQHVVARCLAKDPADRWQSARDVAGVLEMTRVASGALPAPAVAAPRPARARGRVAAALVLTAAAAAVIAHALWPYPSPAPATFQRLTFRHGRIGHARFAPDGQTVVYDARWDGMPSEIYRLRPGNPESKALGITDAMLLAVSSKGELAVQFQPTLRSGITRGILARVPLEGGEPRALRNDVYGADWSPDGSRLAIAPSDSVDFYIQMPEGRTVASAPSALLPMRISPDGRSVAFWRNPVYETGGEIVLAGAGTGERVLCPINFTCTGLAWNPRTREVWYSETDSLGSTALMSVSTRGKRRLLLHLAGTAALNDVAPDGSALLSIRSSRNVVQVQVAGQSAERDLSWLDGSEPVDISPDGRTLVMSELGAGGRWVGATYLRPTDGSAAIRLGEGSGTSLSPDGQWVALTINGEHPRLRAIPVGVGEAHDVPTGDVLPTAGPWYFPDGRRLLFTGRPATGLDRYFEVPIGGGTPRPITPPGWFNWAGQNPISPDGRWVAAESSAVVNRVFSSDGSSSFVVPGVAQGETVLRWTADSRALYVFRRGEVPARIDCVDVATGRRERWKELGPTDRAGVSLIAYALITPDGRSYAYAFNRTQTDLYLVTGLK